MLRRNRVEADRDEEVQFHLQSRIDQQIASGADPAIARSNAIRDLGNVTLLKQDSRETWGWTRCNILFQDVRFALRRLRNSPGFTLTALLTLSFGTGASTAMFSLVDSVLLKPLSCRESGRLVAVWEVIPLMTPEPVGPNPLPAGVYFLKWALAGAAGRHGTGDWRSASSSSGNRVGHAQPLRSS